MSAACNGLIFTFRAANAGSVWTAAKTFAPPAAANSDDDSPSSDRNGRTVR